MGTPQFALHLFFTAAAYNKNAAALQKQDSCAFVIYPAVLVRRLCFLLCSSGCFLVDLALIIHREHDDQNGHSGKAMAMGEVVMAKKLPRWMFM